MEEIKKPKETFDIRLSREEIEYIRNITQNYISEFGGESLGQKKIRLSLFVGSSRLLGFNMNDDGSIKR